MAVRARRAKLSISDPRVDLPIADDERETTRAVALIEVLHNDIERSRRALIRVARVARLTRAARRRLTGGCGFPWHNRRVGVAITLHRLGLDTTRKTAGTAVGVRYPR